MRRAEEAREAEDAFRAANRDIAVVARDLNANTLVPFLCECSERACRAILRMPWREYAAIHEHQHRYIVAPGHELLEVEQLVSESPAYNVVEK
ncbi:MAG TPA: hypothetical protein VHQ89_09210 [Gaiellaceae bacterium]|jgi:hypothetical protein|nr:hypothetical protein [Gaiellaceae bacterium]